MKKSQLKQIIKEEIHRIMSEAANTDLELKSLSKKLIPIIKKYKMGVEYKTDTNDFKTKPKDVNLTPDAQIVIKDGIVTVGVYFLSLARSLDELDMGSGPSKEDYKKADEQARKMYSDVTSAIGDEFEMRSQPETNDYGFYILQIRKKQ